MWERGLKYGMGLVGSSPWSVAPHVGAWIEIWNVYMSINGMIVAPHVGAWIEI